MPFSDDDQVSHALSYNEKSDISDIVTTSDNLCPNKSYKTFSHEYKHLGIISQLVRIDFQTRNLISLTKDTNNSKDYLKLL